MTFQPAARLPRSARRAQLRARSRKCVGSFDYLIRSQQQRRSDGEAERFGGLEIDDELERRGLLDWKITGLRTLEDAIDIGRGATKHCGHARAIAHQTTGFRQLAPCGNHRQPYLCAEDYDLPLVRTKNGRPAPSARRRGHGWRPRTPLGASRHSM